MKVVNGSNLGLLTTTHTQNSSHFCIQEHTTGRAAIASRSNLSFLRYMTIMKAEFVQQCEQLQT